MAIDVKLNLYINPKSLESYNKRKIIIRGEVMLIYIT